jgi:class 3 adenylate cyclase/ligand-binding sensor domain-containing protein
MHKEVPNSLYFYFIARCNLNNYRDRVGNTYLKNLLRKPFILMLVVQFIAGGIMGQRGEAQIKVFEFEEGLSHRIVSKIQQAEDGFVWLGTINGLNRFDGYHFNLFNIRHANPNTPHSVISDVLLGKDNRLWLGSPDYLLSFDLQSYSYEEIKIKEGPFVARESFIPHNILEDTNGNIWLAAYDEKSAKSELLKINPGSRDIQYIKSMTGAYPQRPIIQMNEYIYVGAQDNELWKLDLNGKLTEQLALPIAEGDKIADLVIKAEQLYILCGSGALFTFEPGGTGFQDHPASIKTEAAVALDVDVEGNLWIGGRGILLYYDAISGTVRNYSPTIQDMVKNTCTYKQIYKDQSGVVWVASDFGAIKIVQGEQLFSNYLQGGNAYCSNVFCSTRGITEDDDGNVYISYYSSIHVLDPATDALKPLFPAQGFSNAPFGLTYFDDALWTGNGKRIDLNTRKITNILDLPEKDLGHVVVGRDSMLWMGYLHWLYQYDPAKELLTEFQDSKGKWDSLDGNISYLHRGRLREGLWVGTLSSGFYWLDNYRERALHVHAGDDSPLRLRHNQVNALHEDEAGRLWVGTASGLHCLMPERDSMKLYTTINGLPNDFINGILPEGDSCLWISTDNGLSRFSIVNEEVVNFFTEDGLSANEFNRISFFRSKYGRMYFGGLNGINAFFPGPQFVEQKTVEREAPLLLTLFSKFDGLEDSLIVQNYGFTADEVITISPWDRIFAFEFALADYHDPKEIVYSYQLEGYDKDWSTPSKNHEVRYNNIPAGTYQFRVRAKAKGNQPEWNEEELNIKIIVEEAFYKTIWFWLLIALLVLSGIIGFMRYRFYLANKRREELEELVKQRTKELEEEKRKSEELLLNILPAETAEELKANGTAKAKRHELVTVMFSDFKGFSKISEHMDPEDLVAEIDHCFRAFDEIMEKYELEKIKTVGDAYLCVGGMHEEDDGHEALRVTLAALEIQAFMEGLGIQRRLEGKPFFEARIGIHTGPVIAGIVGIKKFAYDIWGDTVNLAARMETNGAAGKVNVSGTTYNLIEEHFRCTYHSNYTETDGDDIKMYFVEEYMLEI